MSNRESGQSTVLAVFLGAILLVIGLAVCMTVGVVRDAAAAENAADATALAGVTGGRERAVIVAEANSATIETYVQDGAEVQVTVARDGRKATSRAAPGEPGFVRSR
jgi:hypothetical protein